MNAGRLDGAKRAFFTALSIDMAVTVVVVASDYWIVGVLNAVAAGGPPASSSVVGRIQFLESFSGVLILTMLGVGWTLIRWLDACYAHARDTLRARGLQHEKWKTWGWMVPFLNLFKPYQVLSEIFKVGTAGAGRDDWEKASGSGALLAWWIFWTVAHLVMMTIGKAVLKSSSIEGLTLNQIVGIKELQIALCLISLSVAGLWFVVAEKLTSRLVGCLQKPASRVTSSSFAFVGDVRTGNDAYAGALAEIEEGRLDKGVWARAFADAGGDEPKAKALYIKARACASANAEVWEDTQPTAADDTGTYAAVEKPRDEFGNPVPVSTPKWPIWIVAGALPVSILVSLAVSAFKAIPSGQVEAEAATGSQPMAQVSPDQRKGEIALQEKPVPELDLSEFSAENQKRLKDQEANRQADADFNNAYSALEHRAYGDAFNGFSSLAVQGDARGQVSLGSMYYNGHGVAKNYAEAVKWYRLSAAQGNSTAQSNLGAMYALGQGVKQNILLAHMWLNLSAASGNLDAAKVRDTATEQLMTSEQIALAQRMARDCQVRNFKGCD